MQVMIGQGCGRQFHNARLSLERRRRKSGNEQQSRLCQSEGNGHTERRISNRIGSKAIANMMYPLHRSRRLAFIYTLPIKACGDVAILKNGAARAKSRKQCGKEGGDVGGVGGSDSRQWWGSVSLRNVRTKERAKDGSIRAPDSGQR